MHEQGGLQNFLHLQNLPGSGGPMTGAGFGVESAPLNELRRKWLCGGALTDDVEMAADTGRVPGCGTCG